MFYIFFNRICHLRFFHMCKWNFFLILSARYVSEQVNVCLFPFWLHTCNTVAEAEKVRWHFKLSGVFTIFRINLGETARINSKVVYENFVAGFQKRDKKSSKNVFFTINSKNNNVPKNARIEVNKHIIIYKKQVFVICFVGLLHLAERVPSQFCTYIYTMK